MTRKERSEGTHSQHKQAAMIFILCTTIVTNLPPPTLQHTNLQQTQRKTAKSQRRTAKRSNSQSPPSTTPTSGQTQVPRPRRRLNSSPSLQLLPSTRRTKASGPSTPPTSPMQTLPPVVVVVKDIIITTIITTIPIHTRTATLVVARTRLPVRAKQTLLQLPLLLLMEVDQLPLRDDVPQSLPCLTTSHPRAKARTPASPPTVVVSILSPL